MNGKATHPPTTMAQDMDALQAKIEACYFAPFPVSAVVHLVVDVDAHVHIPALQDRFRRIFHQHFLNVERRVNGQLVSVVYETLRENSPYLYTNCVAPDNLKAWLLQRAIEDFHARWRDYIRPDEPDEAQNVRNVVVHAFLSRPLVHVNGLV